MAATQELVRTFVLKARNADQVGTDLVLEFHRIKYDSDATMEVPTNLGNIFFVIGGVATDPTAPAANIIGSDRIITTGAVTVAATASNSDYFDVIFVGTSR